MRSEKRPQTCESSARRAHVQISAISDRFSTVQRATSRAPRVFEAADVTCEQAAKRRHSVWIVLDMRCARDLGDGVTKRARSKAHLGGKERADDAREARAEQHEKRATKTEQVVRRTSPRAASDAPTARPARRGPRKFSFVAQRHFHPPNPISIG